MSVPVSPSISPLGWATTVPDRLDIEFANFIASDISQSILFPVASLPYLIKKHQSDFQGLCNEAQSVLKTHFDGLFDRTEVAVSYRTESDDDTKIQLVFAITVVENDEVFNIRQAVENINSQTLKLMEVNNG